MAVIGRENHQNSLLEDFVSVSVAWQVFAYFVHWEERDVGLRLLLLSASLLDGPCAVADAVEDFETVSIPTVRLYPNILLTL